MLGESKDFFLTSDEKPIFKQATYDKADLVAIVAKQDPLTLAQQVALLTILNKHKNIFKRESMVIGRGKKSPSGSMDVKPYYVRLHLMPLAQQVAMKHKVYQQCDVKETWQLSGKKAEQNEWAFTAFGVAKKNG